MSKLFIKGVKEVPLTFNLLTSTGNFMLDDMIGGGIPIGSTLLLEEDTQKTYTKVLLRYFLAEGIANQHELFIGSLDLNIRKELVNKIPALHEADIVESEEFSKEKLKIAFRYEHLPMKSAAPVKDAFAHFYDLSKLIDDVTISYSRISYFTHENISNKKIKFMENEIYNSYLNELHNLVQRDTFSLDQQFEKKNILRVVLHHLGSPSWGSKNLNELRQFFCLMKCILRKSFALAFITVPTYFSEELKYIFDERLIHLSDIAISMISFAGTKYERNDALGDYHGFFRSLKSAPLGSFTAKEWNKFDYAFKLRKRKFCIEQIQLPPLDLSGGDDKNVNIQASMGCSSKRRNLLDF